MFTQLIAYLVFFLSLNHSSRTFQLINIFHSKECAFVLKSQFALNELESNTIGIICSLIIDKYINCRNQYESLSLKYIYIYNIKKNSKHRKPKTIKFVNYNKHKDIENLLKEQVLLYSSLSN
jgi:hypothetical protein